MATKAIDILKANGGSINPIVEQQSKQKQATGSPSLNVQNPKTPDIQIPNPNSDAQQPEITPAKAPTGSAGNGFLTRMTERVTSELEARKANGSAGNGFLTQMTERATSELGSSGKANVSTRPIVTPIEQNFTFSFIPTTNQQGGTGSQPSGSKAPNVNDAGKGSNQENEQTQPVNSSNEQDAQIVTGFFQNREDLLWDHMPESFKKTREDIFYLNLSENIPMASYLTDISGQRVNDAKTGLDISQTKYESASKDVAGKIQNLNAVADKYGAIYDDDGNLVFQTQEGVDAYNAAIDEYNAALEAANSAYEEYSNSYAEYTDAVGIYKRTRDALMNGALRLDHNKISKEIDEMDANGVGLYDPKRVKLESDLYLSYSKLLSNKDFDEKSKRDGNYGNATRDDFVIYDARNDSSSFIYDAEGNCYNSLGELVFARGEKPGEQNDIYYLDDDGNIKVSDKYVPKVNDPLGMYLDLPEEDRNSFHGIMFPDSYETEMTAEDAQCYEQIRDDEKALYYYLLNTEGTDAAKRYLQSLYVPLQMRRGAAEAERVDSPIAREIAAFGYGVGSFFSGAEKAIDPTIPMTYQDYMMQELQAKHPDGFVHYAIAGAEQLGHMAPYIATSAWLTSIGAPEPVAKGVSLFMMGMSSAGSATANALQGGEMTKGQARAFGILVGASEVGLESVLGGISKLSLSGIGASGLVDLIASKVGNALGKAAIKYAGSIVSEVVEENLQNYLEPAFKIVVGATNQYDAPTFGDFVETTITTVITTGILEAGEIRSSKQIAEYNRDYITPWIDSCLSATEEGSAINKTAKEMQKRISDGDFVSPSEFFENIKNAQEEDGGEIDDVSLDAIMRSPTYARLATAQEQADFRTEQIKRDNPNATVERSASVQAYINTGKVNLNVAKQAGEVLDGILNGDITSENISDSQIDKLHLTQPFGVKATSEVLGVEIKKAASKSEARATFRATLNNIEQSKVATEQTNTAQIEQTMDNAVVAESNLSAESEKTASPAVRSPMQIQTVEQTAEAPAVASAQIEAAPMQEMDALPAPTIRAASENAMSFSEFRKQFENDKAFRRKYSVSGEAAVSKATQLAAAYEKYKADVARTSDSSGAMTRSEFARDYIADNGKASDTDIDLAYQDYLENNDMERLSDTVSENVATLDNDVSGLVQNEYSEMIPAEDAESIDALCKLLDRRIVVDDLGESNGEWSADGDIKIDAAPEHSGAKSAFVFVAAHEIGHDVKSKISKDAWTALEDSAISAKGETAVSDKQASNEVYSDEAVAREDVACDFIGELLSDKDTLDTFLRSIEAGEQTENLTGIRAVVAAAKSFINKITGKQKVNADTAALVQRVQDAFGTDIETARKAVDAMQKAVTAAMKANKNATEDGGVRWSKKDKKDRAVSETPTVENESKKDTKYTPHLMSAKEANAIIERNSARNNPKAPSVIPTAKQAEANRSALEAKAEQYGAIKQGENPSREITVPNRVDPLLKIRKGARTFAESSATNDMMATVLDKDMLSGAFNYTPQRNSETIESARQWVDSHVDVEEATVDWYKDYKGNMLSADMVARGFVIYNNLATAANNATNEVERTRLARKAASIAQDISVMGTVGGQIAQAFRILKQLNPEMRYYTLQRAVNKLQDRINQQYGKDGAPKIEIDKQLAANWMQALREDSELAAQYEQLLFEQIATQVPKSVEDYINAWRYLSMLGNPKTLIRNGVGNAAMIPVVMLKRQFGAVGEAIAQRLGKMDKSERTKSLGFVSATKEGRALLKYAADDILSSDVEAMLDSKKYDDSNIANKLDKAIKEEHSKFKAPGLKQWQKATSYMMEKMPGFGDEFYKGFHYRNAFASAALARGYTVEDFTNGNVSENELFEIRAYATKQALESTFNDANAVSNRIRKLKFKGDSKGAKIGNIIIEGVVPFKGTPANLLVRSVEYSPAGLLKSLTLDIASLKSGKITPTQYIDNLAKGASGTVVWGIGWLAAALGFVRVRADDDDKREGRQKYSLEMFGMSVSLDWLAPASIPFFMGAEMNLMFNHEDGKDYDFLDLIVKSASDIFAPLLEMSVLSGAKELLDTFAYAYNSDGADFEQILKALFITPFFSYAGQFVPTLLGQIANTLEPNRTSTYTTSNDGRTWKYIKRNIAKLTEKIPFVDLWQTEYVDAWGRKDSNGNLLERVFNNFLNPAYTNQIIVTDADEEIRMLKETTDKNVSPSRRNTVITVPQYDESGNRTGEKKFDLSAEQYEAYQTEYGQQYAMMATALMNSDYYKGLEPEGKAEAFGDIESLADELGKRAALGDEYAISSDSSDREMLDLIDSGIAPAEAYGLKVLADQLGEDENIDSDMKNATLIQKINGYDYWTDKQKAAAYTYSLEFDAPEIAGTKPTAEQKTEFKDTYTELANSIFSEVIGSEAFAAADDNAKAEMLADAKELVYFYAKRDYAEKYNLSDDNYNPKKASNKYDTLLNAGLTFDQVYGIKQEFKAIEEDKAYATKKYEDGGVGFDKTAQATDFKKWVDSNRDFTKAQKDVIKDTFKFYRNQTVTTDRYDKLVDVYKMNPDKATQISKRLTGVSKDSEKYSIVDSTRGLSDNEKWTVIKALNDTDDTALAKINTISSAGVSVGEYIAYLDNRPESKSGTKTKWSKSKLKQWLSSEISAGRLTRSAANALWHITDKNWTNDPF